MPWDDIDFDNTLVQGMITGGPNREETVSFADYLNTFSRALDEKYNMTNLYLESNPIVLPNIVFESGEIRNDEWWDRYRLMIKEYFALYTDSVWYTDEVINNRENPDDFEIDDQFIIDLVTQEVFDILSNIDNEPRYKIFTASVLFGCYQIYINLKLRRTSRQISANTSNQIINSPTAFNTGGDTIYFFNGVGGGDSPGAAEADYNSDLDQFSSTNGNLNYFYRVAELSSTRPAEDAYIYRSEVFTNNSYVTLLSKDLEGNTLNMDFYSAAVTIENNFIAVQGVGTSYDSPYDDDVPIMHPGLPSLKWFIEPNEVNQGAQGTKHIYYLTDSPSSTNIGLLPFAAEGESRFAEFSPRVSNALFIVDVNNSALEFST